MKHTKKKFHLNFILLLLFVFSLGNGCTFRMMANYILMREGLPPAIIDVKRGESAVFADNLVCLKENPEIDVVTKKMLIDVPGPKTEKRVDNLIQSIQITVDIFRNRSLLLLKSQA